MENHNELFAKALQEFKNKYPNATIGDLQTFTLGWLAAIKSLEK